MIHKYTKAYVISGAMAAGLMLSVPANAQDDNAALEPLGSERTEIIADDEEGVIRFLVEGEEVARLTRDAFEIRGDVRYGGVMLDQGDEGFDGDDGASEAPRVDAEARNEE